MPHSAQKNTADTYADRASVVERERERERELCVHNDGRGGMKNKLVCTFLRNVRDVLGGLGVFLDGFIALGFVVGVVLRKLASEHLKADCVQKERGR
jgi:hypothetical protein